MFAVDCRRERRTPLSNGEVSPGRLKSKALSICSLRRAPYDRKAVRSWLGHSNSPPAGCRISCSTGLSLRRSNGLNHSTSKTKTRRHLGQGTTGHAAVPPWVDLTRVLIGLSASCQSSDTHCAAHPRWTLENRPSIR